MKNALDHKSNQQLTEEEEKAFNYITWPIWQTKAPFMLRKFERESPDPEILDEDEEPENIQLLDATVKPQHEESKDADQPSPAVVHEMLPSSKLSASPQYEQSRLDVPSTSSASF